MADCIKCGDDYPDERAELGYDLCLKCGEALARLQIIYKSRCVAQHYNKGGYMYLTPGMDLMSLNKKI